MLGILSIRFFTETDCSFHITKHLTTLDNKISTELILEQPEETVYLRNSMDPVSVIFERYPGMKCEICNFVKSKIRQYYLLIR